MTEISLHDAGAVAGSGFFFSYAMGHALTYAITAALNGQVDYAGLTLSQGSSYNMLGA